MKALIPLGMITGLILLAVPVLWFISPQRELSGLRAENSQLRERLAEAKADVMTDALSVVVFGMIAITALLLTGFFLILCLLSNKRPGQFFSVRPVYPALPRAERTGKQISFSTENTSQINDYRHDDRYIII